MVSIASAGNRARFGPIRSGTHPKASRSSTPAPEYALKNIPTDPMCVSITNVFRNVKVAVIVAANTKPMNQSGNRLRSATAVKKLRAAAASRAGR